MKKYFFILAALFCLTTATVNAQEKGDMAAGVHFGFGTGDSFTNMGLGADFKWNVIDNLRLAPSFTYFFKKDLVSMWDISVNAHYQFALGETFRLYPLAGLSMMGVKVSVPEVDLGEYGTYGGSTSDTEFGFNLGGGADFDLSDKLILNVEAKYRIGSNWGRFMANVGLAYRF